MFWEIDQMPDEADLRDKAREAMRQGKLPARPPDRLWVGRGAGAPCAVCGLPVAMNEMEFEIEFQFASGGTPGLDIFHLHRTCFAAWEFERQKSE